MSENNSIKTKIIFDTPSTEDAFDAGGHKRTANSLVETIEQLSDRDGAIGLDGEWGAGKSTVIKIAENELASRENGKGNKYHIFTFDLWSHQTDNFRRSFLEEFVNWLGAKDLLSSIELEVTKNKIRDRIKKVTLNNSKHYSPHALVLLFFAPLIPLFYSWYSPFAFNPQLVLPSFPNGITLTDIVPYLIGAFYLYFLLSFLFRNLQFRKRILFLGLNGKKSFSKRLSETTSLFSRDIQKQTTTQNIRESDPTTVEFHEVFRGLLSKIQKDNNRIVFVIDNIDRLPKGHVVTIWSEVRSLFANNRSLESLTNTWVTAIIPYDREYIVKEFRQNSDDINTDIINKTFDRVLRVSTPIAVDWHNFLNKMLDEGFHNNVDDTTKFRLFKLLDFNFQSKKSNPSPRKIINFVNQISYLWSIWGNEISLEEIALYVLHQEQIDGKPEKILDSNLVVNRYQRIAKVYEWQKPFAALEFNVSPEVAEQILLTGPIKDALTAEKPDALNTLSKADGFKEVLTDVICNELTEMIADESSHLADAANNISSISLEDEVENSVWRELGNLFSKMGTFDFSHESNRNGLLKILEMQPDSNLKNASQELRNIVFASIEGSSGSDFEKGKIFGEYCNTLINHLKDQDIETKYFLISKQLPDNLEFTMGVILACSSSDRIKHTDFHTQQKKDDIVGYIKETIPHSPEMFEPLLKEYFDTATNEHKEDLFTTVCSALRIQGKSNDELKPIISSLMYLQDNANGISNKDSQLDSIINDGTLVYNAWGAEQGENQELLASIIWIITKQNDGYEALSLPDTHVSFGSIVETKEWYAAFFDQSEYDGELIKLLSDMVNKNNAFTTWSEWSFRADKNLFNDVLKHTVEHNNFSRINVASTFKNYQNFKSVLGNDLSLSFLKNFSHWHNSFEEYLDEEVIENLSDQFFNDANSLSDEHKIHKAFTYIDKHIKNQSQEKWEAALNSENDLLRIFLIRQKQVNLKVPIKEFRPAIYDHIIDIIQDKHLPSKYTDQWNHVLSGIKEDSLKPLSEHVFNLIKKEALSMEALERFITYYPIVAHRLPFVNDPDFSLDHIFSHLFGSQLSNVQGFIKEEIPAIKKCLKLANKSAVSNFKTSLIELAASDVTDSTVLIEHQKSLGVYVEIDDKAEIEDS